MRRTDDVPEEILPSIFRESTESDGNWQPARTNLYDDPTAELTLAHYIRESNSDYLNGQKSVADMPVMHYALWNLLDWREPHNTAKAARRFESKLIEEMIEAQDACTVVELSKPNYREHARQDLVGELGDLLFCATAAANMLGADSERAVAHELLEVYGESKRHPTVGYIDRLVKMGSQRKDPLYPHGQFPYVAWNLYVHEDIPEDDLHPKAILELLVRNLCSLLYTQSTNEIKVAGPGSPHRDVAETLVGKLWLFTTFYANHWANSSLKGVIENNLLKITDRVDKGTIDAKTLRSE